MDQRHDHEQTHEHEHAAQRAAEHRTEAERTHAGARRPTGPHEAGGSGPELDPHEAADALEGERDAEAARRRDAPARQDESLISLDTPD